MKNGTTPLCTTPEISPKSGGWYTADSKNTVFWTGGNGGGYGRWLRQKCNHIKAVSTVHYHYHCTRKSRDIGDIRDMLKRVVTLLRPLSFPTRGHWQEPAA